MLVKLNRARLFGQNTALVLQSRQTRYTRQWDTKTSHTIENQSLYK